MITNPLRSLPLTAESAATMRTAWLAEDLVARLRDEATLEIIAAELRYRGF